MNNKEAREQARAMVDAWIQVITDRQQQMRKGLFASLGKGKSYEDDPAYKDAMLFSQTFEPSQDNDTYKWVVEYAKYTYGLLQDTFHVLDDKADAIIKYMSRGTGIVALAAVINVNSGNAFAAILLIPSLVCAVLSIYFASDARKPCDVTGPPAVNKAIAYAEAYDGKGEATFLGVWFATCEGLAASNAFKARRVHLVHRPD